MSTVRIQSDQGNPNDAYVAVEHIVRADFYTMGAQSEAYALVHTPDGNTYRVEGPQALALEKLFARQQITQER